jgi:hypothetical protein
MKTLSPSIIALLSLGLLVGSCSKRYPNELKPNGLPTTRLWVASAKDSILGDTFSRQHLFWYGEDPDGRVVGYLLAVGNYKPLLTALPSPDTLAYVWTTSTDSIVALPLLQAHDVFTVIVRAVDDHFNASLVPSGAHIRLSPQAYWDKDSNGVFEDGRDILLSSLPSGLDPKGAIQSLPIRNQPPNVRFAANPVDSSTIEEPDSTFTVASFSWVGHDPDGDNTIKSYQIALNNPSNPANWFTLNGTTNLVTLSVPRAVTDATTDSVVDAEVYTGTYPNLQLKGKVPGLRLDANNVFYLRAKDIADSMSSVAQLPSTSTKKWFVVKPKNKMLGIVDYSDQRLDRYAVVTYFRNILSDNTILGGKLSTFDLINVGLGLNDNDKKNQTVNQKYGARVPGMINPAFILTLKLFDVVFWFSDLSPSIKPAQIGLFYYTQGGGKVIFSTTFASSLVYSDIRALNDFAPLDSVTSDPISVDTLHTNAESRIPAGTLLVPSNPADGYPTLAFDSLDVFGRPVGLYQNLTMRRAYKRIDSKYIYSLEPAKSGARYIGTSDVAIIDNTKHFVLFVVPISILNGKQHNLSAFFRKVIVDEFGLQ